MSTTATETATTTLKTTTKQATTPNSSNNKESSILNSWMQKNNGFGAHVPEDKIQYLIQTPYGRGLTIRTHPSSKMREIVLLDWKSSNSSTHNDNTPKMSQDEIAKSIQQAAADSQSKSKRKATAVPSKPATLYSVQDFASVEPCIGDQVMTMYGRGVVQEVKPQDKESMYTVLISSWRLANRSRVTCYLTKASLKVVRSKRLYEMNVYEKVEYAGEQKQEAGKAFGKKMYDEALQTYSSALEAVRYVQHTAESNNQVRADLLALMITCSNNAGTCAAHLQQWSTARKFANNASVLVDALQGDRSRRIRTVLERDHNVSPIKLFGQWRVKSLLIQAKANLALGQEDEASTVLRKAYDVIQQYISTSEQAKQDEADDPAARQQLRANYKEIKALQLQCKEQQSALKKKEKLRAQAMFGGGGSSNNKTKKSSTDTDKVDEQPNSIHHNDPSEQAHDMADSKEKRLNSPAKRRVSFSEKVQQYDIYPDENEGDDDVPWYQDAEFLIGLSVFTTAALAAAAATGYLVFGNKKGR